MKTMSHDTLPAKQACRRSRPVREILCVTLALLLVRPAFPASPLNKDTVKQQVLRVSSGSSVEVRLINKSKLRGRLGQVTEEGFELQTVQGGKIDTQTLAFDQVKSIKDTSKKSFSAGKAFLTAGLAIAILVGIGIISCVVGGCES